MRGNYDAVAGFYDRLSRVVFGDAIYQSQVFLLKAVPARSKVLIIGGGTGWILEEIARIHERGLVITYVEISEKMMNRSKKRHAGENQVNFIGNSLQKALLQDSYDVIITPYLFSNFSEDTLKLVFDKIDRHLAKKGLLLFADFQLQEGRIYSRVLLKIMYLFFGFLCQLETSKLPDSAALFHHYGYKVVGHKLFYDGFIFSAVYQKQ